jgi:FdhD protein
LERRDRTTPIVVQRVRRDGAGPVPDELATEEPLAIRVAAGDRAVRVAVTMRTPGDDPELAVGWLHAEGIVRDRRDVADVSWCVRDEGGRQHYNAVTVTLARPDLPDLAALDRHGLISSACGVCGRASLEALADAGLPPVTSDLVLTTAALTGLPAALREAQTTFARTGGLHAAARCTADGDVLALREDVGRHNAVDKLLGVALLDGYPPWHDHVLVLSGRASYELLQKAVVAGVPVVAAIGAPSSLAVEVADAFGITLAGFVRPDRANVYTHPHRIAGASPVTPITVALS